jgi:putative tryptophan/tyrosine transport system substrate-binding protein
MSPMSCSTRCIFAVVPIVGALLHASAVVDAADRSKTWHIGLCHVGLDHEPPSLPTLHQALNEMGYGDGKNLRFDWRNQADEATAEATMKEFVAAGVDLIVAFEDQCVRAAKAATSEIPIVFLHAFDPVAAGYIKSLARPGGNLTGLTSMSRDLAPKRLELIREIVPGISRLAVLTTAKPTAALQMKDTEAAARSLGISLQALEVRDPTTSRARLRPWRVSEPRRSSFFRI